MDTQKQRVLIIGGEQALTSKRLAGIVEELRKQYPDLEVITDTDDIAEAVKPPDITLEEITKETNLPISAADMDELPLEDDALANEDEILRMMEK
ncbi:hypothetical protein LCGC14_0316790 [marine sediment metagenome]|uniref:Uncharacterized protein n=1 Tax=marine sediment metagenome TaxID=412755 RepID=A0A0F9U393_9ZZZZ